ncbi:hypothetical protein J6R97_05360 [bacterium]|nr:hypothetical protein [bacterium]
MRVSAINQNYYASSRMQNLNKQSKTGKPGTCKTYNPAFKDIVGASLGGATGAAATTIAAAFLIPGAGPLAILAVYAGGLLIGGKIGHEIEEKL